MGTFRRIVMSEKIKLELTNLQYHTLKQWIETCTNEEQKALDNCEKKRTHFIMRISPEGLNALRNRMTNILERMYHSCTYYEWRCMNVLGKTLAKRLKPVQGE